MITESTCPCGIDKDDCDYHKPGERIADDMNNRFGLSLQGAHWTELDRILVDVYGEYEDPVEIEQQIQVQASKNGMILSNEQVKRIMQEYEEENADDWA